MRVLSNVSAAILCVVRLHQNFPRPIASFSPLPDIQLSSYTAPNENETVAGPGWAELGTCLLIPAAAGRWQQWKMFHKVDGV